MVTKWSTIAPSQPSGRVERTALGTHCFWPPPEGWQTAGSPAHSPLAREWGGGPYGATLPRTPAAHWRRPAIHHARVPRPSPKPVARAPRPAHQPRATSTPCKNAGSPAACNTTTLKKVTTPCGPGIATMTCRVRPTFAAPIHQPVPAIPPRTVVVHLPVRVAAEGDAERDLHEREEGKHPDPITNSCTGDCALKEPCVSENKKPYDDGIHVVREHDPNPYLQGVIVRKDMGAPSIE